MPTYRITSPDGKTLRIEAPVGASQEEVLAYAQANYRPTESTPPVVTSTPAKSEGTVPEWGMNNPNLFGAYGAARELLQTGLETGGQTIGALGGSYLLPGAGTLAGAGAGYAVGKRVGSGAVGLLDATVGNVDPNAADNSPVLNDIAFGALTQGAGAAIGKGISKVIPQSVIDKLYASSLKIPTTTPNSERNSIIRKGLSERAVPTDDAGMVDKWLGMKGHAQIVEKIGTLNDQVENIIKSASANGAEVDANAVASYLDELLKKGKMVSRVDPNFTNAINQVKAEFLSGPSKIPVEEAQAMKRHIYKVYQDYYGVPDAVKAYIDGKKQIARGIKEQIENIHPEIKSLNMEEGELLNFLDPFNRAIGRIQNRDIVGLGMQTAPMAGAALGNSSGAAQAGAALKFIDTPSIKSRIAILLNKAKNTKPSKSRELLGEFSKYYLNSANE